MVEVNGLTFDFPNSWTVNKYDDWAFYRNQFLKIRDGIKAVDLVAIDGSALWFIEVKDYRQFSRTKPSGLAEEVRDKVLYTLASMLPAKINASNRSEQDFAAKVLRGTELHVILHLEQPEKHSKLFPRAINPDNVQQKLKRLIKPIDPHPKVVESKRMLNLPWSVRSSGLAETVSAVHAESLTDEQ